MNKIDATGLSCPEPVILTKAAVAKGLPLTVLVDNMTAVQNITRFAENAGHKVLHKSSGSDFEVVISK